MQNTAEVVSIGNELLIGQTLDTNSNWIASQLHRFGWNLQRITLLRDSLDAISGGLEESLKRAPELLITVGGLGPTYDDMTLRGVSMAIGRPLVLNKTALELIERRYRRIETPTRLTKYQKKMAKFPKGAKPLPNPIGTAPGVLAIVDQTRIFSLPGVPEEMKAIFKGSIIPILKESNRSAPQEIYLSLVGIIESAIAPVLENAQKKFPGLYFKSHPKGRETGIRSLIQLHIYTTKERNGRTIEAAMVFLIKALTILGKRAGKE